MGQFPEDIPGAVEADTAVVAGVGDQVIIGRDLRERGRVVEIHTGSDARPGLLLRSVHGPDGIAVGIRFQNAVVVGDQRKLLGEGGNPAGSVDDQDARPGARRGGDRADQAVQYTDVRWAGQRRHFVSDRRPGSPAVDTQFPPSLRNRALPTFDRPETLPVTAIVPYQTRLVCSDSVSGGRFCWSGCSVDIRRDCHRLRLGQVAGDLALPAGADAEVVERHPVAGGCKLAVAQGSIDRAGLKLVGWPGLNSSGCV